MGKFRVLFVCTSNSTRSILAEALLRKRAGEHFEIHSAGISPRVVHLMTIYALELRGVESVGLTSKPLDQYSKRFDFNHVIALAENAAHLAANLSQFTSAWTTWEVPDPADFKGSYEERLEAFLQATHRIDEHIDEWLPRATAVAKETRP